MANWVNIDSDEFRKSVAEAVDQTLTSAELSKGAQYNLLKFVIGSAFIGAAASGGIAWALLSDMASDVATRTATTVARETATSTAEETAHTVARATATQLAIDTAKVAAVNATTAQLPQIEAAARDAADRAARNEARSIAAEVATTTALEASTFVSSSRAASTLLGNPEFIAEVSDGALSNLQGAIVAFEDGCPANSGWVPFDEAQGRMIVGIGSTTDEGGETRTFTRDSPIGGEFRHILTEDEMHNHKHAISSTHGSGLKSARYTLPRVIDANNARTVEIPNQIGHEADDWHAAPSGKSKPHNNMPPYIALYFCKKEG